MRPPPAPLVLLIAPLAALAAGAGLFTGGGPGAREHLSVRGHPVAIDGRGLYQHMSAEVAPQGIAQDVVTLFIVFLAILMTALSAKVIAMALLGYEVVPAIVLIPPVECGGDPFRPPHVPGDPGRSIPGGVSIAFPTAIETEGGRPATRRAAGRTGDRTRPIIRRWSVRLQRVDVPPRQAPERRAADPRVPGDIFR